LNKVGGDGVGIVHGDIRCGGGDIGDGVHIASPSVKLVVFARLSNKVDYCASFIRKSPISRGGYQPSSGTGDNEVIRRWITAYHPGN
jgi:hypothetical protein